MTDLITQKALEIPQDLRESYEYLKTGTMTTKANKLVHYWSDDRICALIERIAKLTAEVERLNTLKNEITNERNSHINAHNLLNKVNLELEAEMKCNVKLFDQDDGEVSYCQLPKGHKREHTPWPDLRINKPVPIPTRTPQADKGGPVSELHHLDSGIQAQIHQR